MLEEVNQRVQQILNQSNSKIILGAYQNLINSHNDFCGCNYCCILKEYVSANKELHRHNRSINDVEYDYLNENKVLYDMDKSSYIKIRIRRLKAEKDSLKVL